MGENQVRKYNALLTEMILIYRAQNLTQSRIDIKDSGSNHLEIRIDEGRWQKIRLRSVISYEAFHAHFEQVAVRMLNENLTNKYGEAP